MNELENGSRQVSSTLKGIDFWHKERYYFARFLCSQLKSCSVIDCGCGVGYGSFILSESENVKSIFAFDICEEAISFAKRYYDNSKIKFEVLDFNDFYRDLDTYKFDVLCAFEFLEHLNIKFNELVDIMKCFRDRFKLFIWSLPLENKSKFHYLYFTLQDIYKLFELLSPKGRICKNRLFVQVNKGGRKYVVSYFMRGIHECFQSAN